MSKKYAELQYCNNKGHKTERGVVKKCTRKQLFCKLEANRNRHILVGLLAPRSKPRREWWRRKGGEREREMWPPWHLHIFVEFEVMGVPELRSFWRPATCRTLHCH